MKNKSSKIKNPKSLCLEFKERLNTCLRVLKTLTLDIKSQKGRNQLKYFIYKTYLLFDFQ